MRIAMFVERFPLVSETFILRQVTGLLDLRHEVDVYSNTRPETDSPIHSEVEEYNLLARTTYMDMPPEAGYWEMPVRPLFGRTWPPGSTTSVPNVLRLLRAAPAFLRCLATAPHLTFQVLDPRQYGYQAQSLSALYRLARLCGKKGCYDMLHAHFGPVGNSFRFARELWRAPLLVSFHGYDFCTVPRKEGPGVYRRLFATADGITVNSDYSRWRLEKLGCPSRKIHLLPVGLNPDRFPFRERTYRPGDPVRLLTVARLVEIKGHEFSIRAVAQLRERYPHLRYDIVGDGPLRPRLEQLVRELSVQGMVTLHGSRDGATVSRMMSEADLFLLGSVNIAGDAEGQGLVLQEAQASGLPVVATDHGAFPEGILPCRSGFLVPERDVESLAERLSYLIEHPGLWADMGREGRRYVEERYDIRQITIRLVELYEQMANGRIRRGHGGATGNAG